MANMTCNQGSEWKAPLMLGERQNQKGVGQLVTPCEVRTGKRKQNLAGKAWLGSAFRDSVKHSGDIWPLGRERKQCN